MNLRRIYKPISAILLTIGLVSFGVSPADAAPVHKAPTKSTSRLDTGWG
jgi:hypothetical protein